MIETGSLIAEWAYDTFGPCNDPSLIYKRAETEFEELEEALVSVKQRETYHTAIKVVEECADVVIVLARLCKFFGYELFDMVDEKMAINRKREWVLDGKGQGQHK